MKKLKSTNQIKSPKSAKGMGDYYGTGITAKIGSMNEGTGFEFLSKKQLKTPPKSLA
jgi:hypothetical protein